MFSWLFNKKPDGTVPGFSALQADMHSHLVPGVDDGADTLETSIALLQGLSALGYRRIITTPHIRDGYFPNTSEGLRAGFERLSKEVKRLNLQIELACAAEYHVDLTFFELMAKSDLMTFSGNHLLIEFSSFAPPPNAHDCIFQLKIKGYQPILAHPERYIYYQVADFERLKEMGCMMQTNILSLNGHYGKPVKELAHKLLKAGLVDFMGTDCHNLRHLEELKVTAQDKRWAEVLSKHQFKNAQLQA